jgi:hypothetical protein
VAFWASSTRSNELERGWYRSSPWSTSSGVRQAAVCSREAVNRKSPPYMEVLKASQAWSSASGWLAFTSAFQSSNMSRKAWRLSSRPIVWNTTPDATRSGAASIRAMM